MIDTPLIARKLIESGVKRQHAEAIADVVASAANQQNGTLATKDFVHDRINVVRGEIGDLRIEVSDLRGEMNTKISFVRGEISASETRIVRWIVGTGIAIAGLLVTSVGILLSTLL